MLSRVAAQSARASTRTIRANQVQASRTLTATSRRWAEVTVTQPQDLVERSLKPGTEADPQCKSKGAAVFLKGMGVLTRAFASSMNSGRLPRTTIRVDPKASSQGLVGPARTKELQRDGQSLFTPRESAQETESFLSYSCMNKKMRCQCGLPMFTLHRQVGLSPRYVQHLLLRCDLGY
jgi:hypothetical protein